MNKKIITVAAVAVLAVGTAFAGPKPPPGGGRPGGHRPPPAHHHGGHHSGGSAWGRGGRNFWPGFLGGLVGASLVRPAPPPPPVVVAPAPVVVSPTYVTQKVWVEGRYIDQVQANGTVIRVWQPGHYEYTQVLVQ